MCKLSDKHQGPRSKVTVPCPDIVKQYNAFMGGGGGINLADMLIALVCSHRWYLATSETARKLRHLI